MDFYIIELRDRIKIGISKTPKKRVNSIQLSSGISDKEIISLHYFENGSSFESRLKRIFNPYQTKGEWFTKKNTVKLFIDKINNGSLLNNELIEELKYSPSVINHAYYKQAKKTYEKIKEERKGIGYPDSVSIEKILKNNKVVYRHIDYILSNDYKTYTRKLKFEIDNINQPQLIQCLRTIKNLSKCTDESNHTFKNKSTKYLIKS